MTDLLDLRPTSDRLTILAHGVRDDQLTDPTPCPAYTVADLLDHLDGVHVAFTAAARKQELPAAQRAPEPDGSRLTGGWREALAKGLATLATAWQDPAAYQGSTWAGPVELPAPVAAAVALNEITVHAWDLAAATGQRYDPDPAAVAASQTFVGSFEPPAGGPADDGGLFGPPLAVPADASALAHLLAATGRDPGWRR